MKQFFISVLAIAALALVQPASVFASNQDYRYVALGDSVSAGFGLPVTSISREDIVCGRSLEAYPQQIADYYQIPVQNVSCAGAKIDEGLYGNQERGGQNLQPQLDAAFAGGTPNLITITAGANDLRWSWAIYQCTEFNCGDSRLADLLARAYVADLRIELNAALAQIEQRSNGTPPLVALSGYYNPFSGNTTCADAQGITTDEAAWLSTQSDALNSTIEAVSAAYWFAEFVPIDFTGHELCSAEPWVQGANDAGAYHPNLAGQRAISDAFLQQF